MQQREFLNIVLPLKDKLFRIAKRLLSSEDEAADAVQEVFLKLWKNKAQIARYKSPEAYAVTMVKNYCLDRLKSKQASQLKIVHSNYKATENTARKIEARQEVDLMFKIIEQLPEQQRIVIQLRDIEHYEFSEIAEMLNNNETAIRVTLSRARKTVRQALLKQMNYGIEAN